MLEIRKDLGDGIIECLHPTPIYTTIIKNLNSVQLEISNIIDKVKFDGAKGTWGKTSNLTALEGNVIETCNLDNFKKELDYHLRVYCDFLQFQMPEYNLTSWFSKNNKGNYTHVHNHTFNDIVGCYYYKTNTKDGDLFFMPPLSLETAYCYQSQAERWRHPPVEGKLLLFPGYLPHGVTTNEYDNDRICLAFSINFKR